MSYNIFNSRVITLKIEERFADAVLDERKTFEIRYDDRLYQVGDTIKFEVIDSNGEKINHLLNKKTYLITYILSNYTAINSNFIVFSIKEIKRGE